MSQLDMESLHPAGPQDIHRHGDHLQVGLLSSRADELHPALCNLTAAALVLLTGAKHRLVVVEPLGQRHRLQLGGGHPGDGGCAVGAHHHDLARPVDDLQHALLGHGVA